MATSMAALSRRLHRSLLSNPKTSQFSMSFCTTNLSHSDSESDDSSLDTERVPDATPESSSSSSNQGFNYRPLENGLDVGIYKAILVGQVGQAPFQRKFKNGRTVTMLSVGTGGIHNYRRPLEDEDPKDYANRCLVQWHRVAVFPVRLGELIMKNIEPGSILYLEGNLETKVFTDPVSGVVRRIREIAIHQNGRLVFLGKGDDAQKADPSELRRVGYF